MELQKNIFGSLIKKLPLSILIPMVLVYKKTKKIYLAIFSKKQNQVILDDDGIPYVKYGYKNGINLGSQRNPVTISQKAMNYYDEYQRKGTNSSRTCLYNCANWIVENSVIYDDYAILEYNFTWPLYNLEKPWRSGMAQGQAIQALIKANEIFGEKKFLDSAKLLLNSFFIEVKDGGVTYKSKEGWWYEEYASNNCKVSKVLNGMIFTILGIYDYYQYTNDSDAKILFDKGVLALKNELPKFDYKGFSYYDVLGNLAHEYHAIHIDLLKKLYDLTKEDVFKYYHDGWKKTDYYKHVALTIKSEK